MVVGDAIAEGVVTVLQKSLESESAAEAIIIIAAATSADVNLKETIVVGCVDEMSMMRGICRTLHYTSDSCRLPSAVCVSDRAGGAQAVRCACGWSQESEAGRWASLSRTVRAVAVNGRVGGWVRVRVRVKVRCW